MRILKYESYMCIKKYEGYMCIRKYERYLLAPYLSITCTPFIFLAFTYVYVKV